MVYLAKKDLRVFQVPREVEDHQGLLDQKDLKEGKVIEACKELLDLPGLLERLAVQVTLGLLVPLENLELLE